MGNKHQLSDKYETCDYSYAQWRIKNWAKERVEVYDLQINTPGV